MNPLLKKVLAAIAIKEGIEKVQEWRNPKPSRGARLAKFTLLAGTGAGLLYAYKTGRIHALLGKSRDQAASSWDRDTGQVRTTVPTESGAPAPGEPVGASTS